MSRYKLNLPIIEVNIDEFLDYMRVNWSQSEHVAITGATGLGKTTLASDLLDSRTYVVVLALKPKDETLNFFKAKGYKIYTRWPPERNDRHIILWIKPKDLHDFKSQQGRVGEFLNSVYVSGGWTVYLDEAGLIGGELRLGPQLGRLLNQGRSLGLTVVAVMTRPTSVIARVPKEAITQVKWKIFFRPEPAEVPAMSDMTGLSEDFMLHLVEELGDHDFFVVERNKRIILVRFTR